MKRSAFEDGLPTKELAQRAMNDFVYHSERQGQDLSGTIAILIADDAGFSVAGYKSLDKFTQDSKLSNDGIGRILIKGVSLLRKKYPNGAAIAAPCLLETGEVGCLFKGLQNPDPTTQNLAAMIAGFQGDL
jgi:hypothetical protein